MNKMYASDLRQVDMELREKYQVRTVLTCFSKLIVKQWQAAPVLATNKQLD